MTMAPRLRLVLLRVAFYATAVFVLLPMAFCHVMTRLPRPANLEAAPAGYEEIRVPSEGLSLRGWLACTPTSRAAALVIHGLGDSIESYTPLANALRRRGHPVLLLDLRGHGGSDGTRTTLGDHEREDVRAGIERLHAEGLADSGVILFGHSMGGVAVLRAAAGRNDVRAVVVEAPFDTLRETIAHHGELLYHIPGWFPIAAISLGFAQIAAGFDADHVDAVAAAREIRAPLLVIADGADVRMPEPVVRRIADAHPGVTRVWVVPGAGHLGAMLDADYDRRIQSFLSENGL
jgi:pimeloyl-ACP methyl ester carboxylesterase